MDFFQSQESARRRTRLLVLYFAAALVCIIGAIYAVFIGFGLHVEEAHVKQSLWQPELLGMVAAGVGALVGMGSGWKAMQLSGGGAVVARDLGGRPVPLQPSDPEERRLRNVVEEMALASGMPVPEIYLLEQEGSINAFAAGRTPAESAIGVTRGCIKSLTRDELQGVIAHEFSHILNGDMRLSTRLIAILHGILLIAIVGRIALRLGGSTSRSSGSSREKGGGALPIALIGLAFIVIGYIGVFFGKLIKSAVSRQREFLADASAVQFTRNPGGIGGALKKIGGASLGSTLQTPNAEEASHMFFANGLAESFMQAFATHPPLPERIRALDPQWDGQFVAVKLEAPAEPKAKMESRTPPPIPGFPGGLIGAAVLGAGSIGPAHIERAQTLHREIPETLRGQMQDPLGAATVIFALLLSREENVRAIQLDAASNFAPQCATEIEKHAESAARASSRLALVELAIPSLRELSPAQYAAFKTTLTQFVEADQQIDLFEFAVQKMVRRHLGASFGDAPPPAIRHRASSQVLPQIRTVLSALAHLGGSDPAAAFARGAAQVSAPGQQLTLAPLAECGLGPIDSALDTLAASVPMVKKNVLYACANVALTDQVVDESELELLRAIADTLDVPIPPLVRI